MIVSYPTPRRGGIRWLDLEEHGHGVEGKWFAVAAWNLNFIMCVFLSQKKVRLPYFCTFATIQEHFLIN